MRNRAKCRLCGSILESFHKFDYVSCKCGEIAISGGESSFETSARDYANFLRVADDGREIEVKVVNEESLEKPEGVPVVGKMERISQLIDQIESLPGDVMSHQLTHYDLLYILRLIKEVIS